MDAHNVPGKPAAIAPVAYTGGTLAGGKLVLDLPAKSVVVVKLD
jgi:alpha-N-arabinofuranosidase